MTQEQKDLLIKDLCARLPYGIKISKVIEDFVSEPRPIRSINLNNIIVEDGEFEDGTPDIDVWNYEDIKSYLFPLSNMTKEQFRELNPLLSNCAHSYQVPFKFNSIQTFSLPVLEWFLKNHFDVYGLIPMGLAKDATGLNIY